ncbi:MAG: TonB-dependent receptor, partial [Delftia acidovorans]|nr:TonB-dependent receptor [Delftia acidovorans]
MPAGASRPSFLSVFGQTSAWARAAASRCCGVPGAAPVGSETSMDYEAGLKGNLFGRVNFGLSAYWEEFDNFQAQSYADTDTPGVGTFLIQNVGTLRARGFEGNLSARLGRILTLSAS